MTEKQQIDCMYTGKQCIPYKIDLIGKKEKKENERCSASFILVMLEESLVQVHRGTSSLSCLCCNMAEFCYLRHPTLLLLPCLRGEQKSKRKPTKL